MSPHRVDVNDKVFARDEQFWNNYLKGRPQPPKSFFERIYRYHEAHGGKFDVVHDVGAGNGPYSAELRSRFDHVIVSDIVKENVRLAEERLGHDGFTFREAKVEDDADVPAGTVDLVFATNVMHFVDQKEGMQAIARQLKSGGTLAVAGFGPALFHDDRVQAVWKRISEQGGRVLFAKCKNQEERITTFRVMKRTQDRYDLAPLDENDFLPGGERIHLNHGRGGITGIMPPEEANLAIEPSYIGLNDKQIFEESDGWAFKWDLSNFKVHFGSFPHSKEDPEAFESLWNEIEDLIAKGARLDGVFPANIILATRR